jgi:hypothetical protein
MSRMAHAGLKARSLLDYRPRYTYAQAIQLSRAHYSNLLTPPLPLPESPTTDCEDTNSNELLA